MPGCGHKDKNTSWRSGGKSIMSWRKWKFKQDVTTYLYIRMAKIQNTDTTKCWQGCQQEFSFLVQMQNGTALLGDSLVASHNTKYILTIWSSNYPAGIYPQELKMYVCTKTCTQMFIEALLIIAQTEATKMSSSRWVDKQTLAHPDDRMVVSPKNKWAIKPWRDLQRKWKESICEGCILNDSNYTTFWKRQKLWRQ